MTTVSLKQVQSDFSSVRTLMDRGEPIALEEDGVVIGTLVPVFGTKHAKDRKDMFGSLEGQIKVPEDFDEMMRDEIEEMFYGKP